MTARVVDIAQATKRYRGRAAVDAVTLDVQAGESLALLGHNGAGKTTLMKLILGLVRPNGGAVRVFGEEAAHSGAVQARKGIGFLPEDVTFPGNTTGRALLGFYARLKGVPPRECRALLERVGLAEAADRRIRTYSKGMRQRLGLAQALLGAPGLLLLDEPTSGLDPGFQRDLFALLRAATRAGAAVLLSSHTLTEVEARRLERIAIMKNGRLAACGTLDELRAGAALPAQVRVTVAPGAAAAVAARLGNGRAAPADDRTVAIACPPGETIALLRRIAALDGAVRDAEIRPPPLDALYAHYRGDDTRP